MNDSPRDSLRVFAVSLVLAFSLFALWSQLTPLGSAPDEASHYVKAAAVVRGEWIGEPLDGWRIAVEGWAYSDTSTIAEVILLDSDGSVLARSAPNVVREDVNAALQLPVDAKIGFDLSLVSSERREPAAAVALLNDGTLASLPFSDNLVQATTPTNLSVDGRPVNGDANVQGLVDDVQLTGRMEYSYWSSHVDIDKQFDGSHEVQRCFVAQATVPACDLRVEDWQPDGGQALTTMGLYTPVVYLVPGVATLLGASNVSWFLARIISALVAAIILALAVTSLRVRKLTIVPLLAVTVPAVVYLASVVNTSGLEIIGAIGIWLSLPGLLSDARRDMWALWCFSLSGLIVILARPLGMVYFITIVAVCTIASGRITALLDFARRHLWISAAHLGAIAFASFWYLAIYNPRVDPRMAEHLGPDVALFEQLAHSFGDITRVLQEAVGDLGSLEVPIPRLATLAILLLSSWIITTGWRDASRSVRLATIALIALCVVAIIAIDLNYYRILRGYGVQGRHLTPLLVGIPLLAARRARFTNGQRYTIGAIWVIAHLLAGYTALRRYSVGLVGDEVLEVFYFPQWQPALGIVGTLFALTLLLLTTATVTVRTTRAEGGD